MLSGRRCRFGIGKAIPLRTGIDFTTQVAFWRKLKEIRVCIPLCGIGELWKNANGKYYLQNFLYCFWNPLPED